MAHSILALAEQLDETSVICSGHDYLQCFAMNWEAEQQQTPLLNGLINGQMSIDEFVIKKQLDDQAKEKSRSQLCGYVTALPESSIQQLNFDSAKAMLTKNDAYLIDTREPYEHGANNVAPKK